MGGEENPGIDEQRKNRPMELNHYSQLDNDKLRYQKAKTKAREIRDFYINLSLFCLFIPVIISINLIFVPQFHWFWFSIIGWGTGVVFHGLSAFDYHPFMNNNWEERKIQQFMQEDLEREKKDKKI